MQVNKYRAQTISEATAKVRSELGPDAMILSTKRLEGNARGPFFEITAALTDEHGASGPYRELKSDLMSIKEMIYILNHSGGLTEKLVSSPPALNLYAKLIRNGVNDTYARMLLEKGGIMRDVLFAGSNDDIQHRAVREMGKLIAVDNPLEAKGNGRVISALVGTTGVGKTTTLAKIAARLTLKANKNVGLISIDNYRIGAIEQLKTYAGILGIPCFPAFNRKDLLFALKRLDNRDVVLIDTAGQSQYDMSRIEELKRMMTDDLDIRTHLLLSIATSEQEMEKTAENFEALKFQSYIFTKIDESKNCGSMLNQIMKKKLPISYITTGQNVPEDIESARKEKIVKLILNPN